MIIASCSKLMTLLVNISLKFQMLVLHLYTDIFVEKKDSHIFFQQKITV